MEITSLLRVLLTQTLSLSFIVFSLSVRMGISFLNIDIIVRIHHQTHEPRFLIIPPLYVRLCPSSPSLKIPHSKTVTRLVVSSHTHTPPASLEIPKLFPLVSGCPLSVLAGVAGNRAPLSRYILKFLFPHHLSRQPTFVDSCAVATLPPISRFRISE